MSFASSNLLPEENESILQSIENDVEGSGWFRLPIYLEERPDQPFVCFVVLKTKPGMEQAVVDITRDIRAETDQNELEGSSHHHVPAFSDIWARLYSCTPIGRYKPSMKPIETYDSAEAFRTHYRGKNIARLYKAGVLSEPPKLNFFVDVQ
ncbi:hypothetical protein [Phaffia rhodozyma]|uniref:Uncharacterized protein n=1 Tax=Phaffia rhodozyma TaxID=264483 RepID=A0A0F7SMX0_PHARH|nr:hypothetical protein [Phaffia rhodozyma]